MEKILIVYYSYSGNTREVANQIKHLTGGDLFEVQPQQAYPTGYQAVVDQARKEISSGYKPALKSKPDSINQYDVILIGSPCWWSTIAPPLATFLSSYDFSGKTVALFMTHEGSQLGHSLNDIQTRCPTATIQKGLAIRGSSVKTAQPEVRAWLKGLKLID